jgi:DNA polymerase-3 subunit beta
LVIRSGGRASNKLKGIEADQFPALPEPESEDAMTLPAEAFQDMIGQVVFAAAKEDNRPILMGIQTRLDSEKISMVAADGFRMSLRTSLLSDGSVRPVTLVIPAKTLVELARIDPGETNEVHIAVAQSRSQVIFNVGTVDIVSQLIDGKFPDVEHLIPKAAATTTIVNTKDLMVACKNAEIVARNVNNTTRLSIKPNRNAGEFGAVVVSAEASERGANEWTIEGTIDGPGLEIAFNVRYMIEVLSVIKEDQVVLETNGANQPGVVKPIGRQDFVYVIMPMSTR